jgi:hypothetical protein
VRRCRRPSDRGRPGLLTGPGNAVIHVWRSASRTGEVKTPKSKRSLELPKRAVTALQAHRKRQAAERLAAGPAWQDSNLVFCHEDSCMSSVAGEAVTWPSAIATVRHQEGMIREESHSTRANMSSWDVPGSRASYVPADC